MEDSKRFNLPATKSGIDNRARHLDSNILLVGTRKTSQYSFAKLFVNAGEYSQHSSGPAATNLAS